MPQFAPKCPQMPPNAPLWSIGEYGDATFVVLKEIPAGVQSKDQSISLLKI